MGWIGFLAVVPWIQALGWAFRPTTVIDVRYLPKERQHDTEAMIAKLTGKAPPETRASRNHGRTGARECGGRRRYSAHRVVGREGDRADPGTAHRADAAPRTPVPSPTRPRRPARCGNPTHVLARTPSTRSCRYPPHPAGRAPGSHPPARQSASDREPDTPCADHVGPAQHHESARSTPPAFSLVVRSGRRRDLRHACDAHAGSLEVGGNGERDCWPVSLAFLCGVSTPLGREFTSAGAGVAHENPAALLQKPQMARASTAPGRSRGYPFATVAFAASDAAQSCCVSVRSIWLISRLSWAISSAQGGPAGLRQADPGPGTLPA